MTTHHLHPPAISTQGETVMVGSDVLQPNEAQELAARFRAAANQLIRAAADAERYIRTTQLQADLDAEVRALTAEGWTVYMMRPRDGVVACAEKPGVPPIVICALGHRGYMRQTDTTLHVRYHRAETRVRLPGGRVAHTVTKEHPEQCTRCRSYVGSWRMMAHLAAPDLPDCKVPKRPTKPQRQLPLAAEVTDVR